MENAIEMCYLVTIGTCVPQSELQALLGDQSLLWVRPSKDPVVRTMFAAEDRLYEVLNGACSCDFVIDSAPASLDEERSKRRIQYQKKGWSESKIARALSGWEEAHDRQLRSLAAPRLQFIAFLQSLASRGEVVRVFVHFYTGPLGDERLHPLEPIRISADSLSSAGVIAEDSLIEIGPSR